MKRDLERAIKAAGSVKAAAFELGISDRTLRRWRKVGLPKRKAAREDAQRAIRAYTERRKASRKQAADDLKKLKRLRREAEAKQRQRGQPLAPVKTFQKPMDGRVAEGYTWVKAYRRELTLDTIDDIERWARTLKGKRKWPMWLARVRMVLFTHEEDVEIKSGDTIDVMVDDPDRNAFIAEQFLFTPRGTRPYVLDYARGQLEALAGRAATIFVLSVEMSTFRLRSEEERSERSREYNRRRYAERTRSRGRARRGRGNGDA